MDVRDETRLARQLVEAAAKAMATLDGAPLTERVLKEYREEAKGIVPATMARLVGSGGVSTLFPRGGLETATLATLVEEMGRGKSP